MGYTAGIVLVVISSVLTAILFESMATGTWMGKMFAVGGLSVDVGKIVTASLFAYYLRRKLYTSSLLPLGLYILCFIVSMVASQSLDLNKANEIRNETVLSSEAYTMNMSTFESAKEDISYYRNKIKKIQASEQARIQAYLSPLSKQRLHAKRNKWLTTPAGSPREGVDVIERKMAAVPGKVKNEIRAEVAALESKIESANNRQSSSKSNIDSMKNGGGVKATEGLIAYAEWINPDDPQKALGNFYLFKNLFTEILGTYLLVCLKPAGRNQARVKTKQGTNKQEERQASNVVSLVKKQASKQAKITQADIEKYERFKADNPTMGYKKISSHLGFSQNKAYEIHKIIKERKMA